MISFVFSSCSLIEASRALDWAYSAEMSAFLSAFFLAAAALETSPFSFLKVSRVYLAKIVQI